MVIIIHVEIEIYKRSFSVASDLEHDGSIMHAYYVKSEIEPFEEERVL